MRSPLTIRRDNITHLNKTLSVWNKSGTGKRITLHRNATTNTKSLQTIDVSGKWCEHCRNIARLRLRHNPTTKGSMLSIRAPCKMQSGFQFKPRCEFMRVHRRKHWCQSQGKESSRENLVKTQSEREKILWRSYLHCA